MRDFTKANFTWPMVRLVRLVRCLGMGLVALKLSGSLVWAHPDLIEQIAKITAELGTQGGSAALYLQRADLFRRHTQFDAALLDIAAAERCQTNTAVFSLDRARVLWDADRAAEALASVQAFLVREPDQVEALIIRARCEAKLGKAASAVADYTAAIARAEAPMPDLFLERARQQAKLGEFAAAVRGLDEAIAFFPLVPSLQLAAIDYDRRRGAFDPALARVDELIKRYPVKAPWLTLRAEVLEQAGRTNDAHQTFGQVLAEIEAYPPVRRSLDLTKQLEHRVRQGLSRCGSTNGTLIVTLKHEVSPISAP